MSASVSVTPRVNQITAKCDQLIESLENVKEIDSSEVHAMLLLSLRDLEELLPCGARDEVDLMEHHISELESFASEQFGVLLMELVTKFGKSQGQVPAEIASLVGITDNVSFILETMNVLSDVKVIDKCPHLTVQLLEQLLQDDSYLTFAITRISHTQLSESTVLRTDQFIQQLISLPDKIANKLKSNFPRVFELRKFSAILMLNALKSFHIACQINKMEQSIVYSMNFLSKLISRIFVHFKGDKTVLLSSLGLMSSMAGQELYRQSLREVMKGLQRPAVEIAAQLAFGNESKTKLVWMFGDVWKTSSDWKFVLLKKIPLLSFSNDDRTVENLAFFLANEDEDMLEQLLIDLLMVWSTKSHVIDAPFDQHFYVTKLIVLLTKYLSNPKEKAEKIKQLLFNGMQVHLGSTDRKIQVVGMITAEVVLGVLDKDAKDEDKLKFDFSDVSKEIAHEVVDVIRGLPEKTSLESPTVTDDDVTKMMQKLISIVEQTGEPEITQKPKVAEELRIQEPSKVPEQTPQRLDSDDDDDLQPYDDPDDLPRYDQKRPRYLLDIIQAFASKESREDAEVFELTMTSAEDIINQQLPSHHADIAVDLVMIFLKLNKATYLENFDELKMKLLVLITSIHPKECAQFLCKEFNTESQEYSIIQRISMLEILAEVAKKLSKLEIPKREDLQGSSTSPVITHHNKLLIRLNEELENRNKKDAQKIIRQRLLAKTRRIATRTKAPYENSGLNRFADVAGWFFFPLVHGFGRKQMVFKTGTHLQDEIFNELLVKFINTIAVMMLCAENSIIAPKMGKEIVSLSVFLRYHEESKIRLAVLHMVATIVLAVPQKILINEFSREISEFINHLGMIVRSSVVNYERDQECREFAKQLMGMFQQVLYAHE